MKCPYCDVYCYYGSEDKRTFKCCRCRFSFKIHKEKDLLTTYKLFRKMLIRLSWSYTCTKFIPKTELEQTFYRSNDGKGFTSDEVEFMSKICWNYFIFLNRNYDVGDKVYISHSKLMEEIIYSFKIDKCFLSKSNRPIPYWKDFLTYWAESRQVSDHHTEEHLAENLSEG